MGTWHVTGLTLTKTVCVRTKRRQHCFSRLTAFPLVLFLLFSSVNHRPTPILAQIKACHTHPNAKFASVHNLPPPVGLRREGAAGRGADGARVTSSAQRARPSHSEARSVTSTGHGPVETTQDEAETRVSARSSRPCDFGAALRGHLDQGPSCLVIWVTWGAWQTSGFPVLCPAFTWQGAVAPGDVPCPARLGEPCVGQCGAPAPCCSVWRGRGPGCNLRVGGTPGHTGAHGRPEAPRQTLHRPPPSSV